jgi:hypothetical protein
MTHHGKTRAEKKRIAWEQLMMRLVSVKDQARLISPETRAQIADQFVRSLEGMERMYADICKDPEYAELESKPMSAYPNGRFQEYKEAFR